MSIVGIELNLLWIGTTKCELINVNGETNFQIGQMLACGWTSLFSFRPAASRLTNSQMWNIMSILTKIARLICYLKNSIICYLRRHPDHCRTQPIIFYMKFWSPKFTTFDNNKFYHSKFPAHFLVRLVPSSHWYVNNHWHVYHGLRVRT